MPHKFPLWLCIVALLSITGSTCILIATVHGVGVSPDSIAYIGAARNLVEGRGLTLPYGALQDAPLTQFPPMYPWLLAVGGQMGMTVLQVARWLQTLLFGLQIFCLGLLLHRYGRPWIAVGGSVLLLTSPTLLNISIMAWTESLFVLLCLVAIWLLARFLDSSKRSYLFASTLIVGVATLTRYSGIALVITGCVALLLVANVSFRKRLLNSFLFGLVSVLPLALWMVRNMSVAGSATNRQFSVHPIGRSYFLQALDTIAGWWMVPDVMPIFVKVGVVLLSVAAMVVALWLTPSQTTVSERRTDVTPTSVRSFLQLLALFVLTYFAFLALSISFVDANTPLDARILAPVYLVVVFLVLYAIHQISAYLQHRRLVQIVLVIGMITFVALSARQVVQIVADQYIHGKGFASVAWQKSEIIELTRNLPAETPIFSNAPDALYFLADRRTLGIPKKSNAMTQQPNSHYEDELEMMRQTLETEEGVVVYLTKLGRASASQEAELQRQFALSLLAQTGDGVIYGVTSAQELAVR